jgi:putative FmdB family regulatory protein
MRKFRCSARLELCFLQGSVSGMPTYEYHCQKCDKNFEMFQSMRDKPLTECPKDLCRLPKWGHGKVKRLLGTGAGIIFKGSGFYITDYRSKDYREAAKKEVPSSGTTEKASGGKESKTGPDKASPSAPTKKSKGDSAA